MINRVPLREALLTMFPATEDIFYAHIEQYAQFNVQYGQVLWYYNNQIKIVAIRDGDFKFYISSEDPEITE